MTPDSNMTTHSDDNNDNSKKVPEAYKDVSRVKWSNSRNEKKVTKYDIEYIKNKGNSEKKEQIVYKYSGKGRIAFVQMFLRSTN